jgi:hypothetical protein
MAATSEIRPQSEHHANIYERFGKILIGLLAIKFGLPLIQSPIPANEALGLGLTVGGGLATFDGITEP